MSISPQDSGLDVNPVWAAIVAIGAFFFAFMKKLDPKPIFNAIVEYTAGPVMDKRNAPIISRLDSSDRKLDALAREHSYTRRVITHMPGAKEALERVKEEDAGWPE